ncbi:hypothetical protein [Yoonia sp.]|uniref:hypothetical protein n=1 Tax=Yoonia sp. TaxID=2212373 RepID=UPI00391BBD38
MPDRLHDFLTDLLSGQNDATCQGCDLDQGLTEMLLDRSVHRPPYFNTAVAQPAPATKGPQRCFDQ